MVMAATIKLSHSSTEAPVKHTGGGRQQLRKGVCQDGGVNSLHPRRHQETGLNPTAWPLTLTQQQSQSLSNHFNYFENSLHNNPA